MPAAASASRPSRAGGTRERERLLLTPAPPPPVRSLRRNCARRAPGASLLPASARGDDVTETAAAGSGRRTGPVASLPAPARFDDRWPPPSQPGRPRPERSALRRAESGASGPGHRRRPAVHPHIRKQFKKRGASLAVRSADRASPARFRSGPGHTGGRPVPVGAQEAAIAMFVRLRLRPSRAPGHRARRAPAIIGSLSSFLPEMSIFEGGAGSGGHANH